MNVVIVEDERGAADHLKSLLNQTDSHINIQAVLQSVDESVHWFNSANSKSDLGFFDIKLQEELSFEIFKKVEINFPVIFTTAFNQYAIQAFKVNSIDYLLKPLKLNEINRALAKFTRTSIIPPLDYKALAKELSRFQNENLYTLLVTQRDKLVPIPSVDFSYFYVSNGLLHGSAHGRNYALNSMTMDELQERLDRRKFFRINRQYIVNRAAIVDLQSHFHGRLALRLNPPVQETVTISKTRVADFKTWLSSGIQ